VKVNDRRRGERVHNSFLIFFILFLILILEDRLMEIRGRDGGRRGGKRMLSPEIGFELGVDHRLGHKLGREKDRIGAANVVDATHEIDHRGGMTIAAIAAVVDGLRGQSR